MARIPTLSRLAAEDFPPDQRNFAQKLFLPLNQFLTTVVQALNRGLTFSENFRCQEREITFRYSTDLPLYFANELGTKPKLLIVGQCVQIDPASGEEIGSAAPAVAWRMDSQNRVQIDSLTNLTEGHSYKLRLLLT